MKRKAINFVVGVALTFAPMSQVSAQSETLQVEETYEQNWVPATPEQQRAARGGAVPLFAVAYVGGTWVIRQCLVRGQACVNGAVATFRSIAAARRFTCTNYRRFC